MATLSLLIWTLNLLDALEKIIIGCAWLIKKCIGLGLCCSIH
jgi:hypothetical protein